jgi:starch phosphorylase
VEIREQVGEENIFIFGLTAAEVEERRRQGISGRAAIEASPVLRETLDAIGSGVFSPGEPGRFAELVDVLTNYDHFLVTADFDSYYASQRAVGELWRRPPAWWKASALNTARMGWFSSDRTIREYAQEIWEVPTRGEGS